MEEDRIGEFFTSNEGKRLICVQGDGNADTEDDVDTARNVPECEEKVRDEQPTANGITIGRNVGTDNLQTCYAEFEYFTGADYDDSGYQSCFLDHDTSFDRQVLGKYFTTWNENTGETLRVICILGDGEGGTEFELVGKAKSVEECIDMVRDQKPEANGLTIYRDVGDDQPRSCYAEIGMKGADKTDSNYQACYFEGRLILDLSTIRKWQ